MISITKGGTSNSFPQNPKTLARRPLRTIDNELTPIRGDNTNMYPQKTEKVISPILRTGDNLHSTLNNNAKKTISDEKSCSEYQAKARE